MTDESWGCNGVCVPGCPVAELDAQSGSVGGGFGTENRADGCGRYGKFSGATKGKVVGYGDFGGASRFFPTFAWGDDDKDDLRAFYYCGKATRQDRDEGCRQLPEGSVQDYRSIRKDRGDGYPEHSVAHNHHPTIKPTPLMRWLCRLVTPPGGTILDPFLGSGSTLKAAKLEGFGGIGIEISSDYLEIARRRIAHAQPALAGLA